MRILVVHAWLKGNLGDVLQLSVLMSALRELRPQVLDLAGYPARPADAADDVLALCDHYWPDPFVWYWHPAPALGRALVEPRWRKRRRTFFSRYDAIVCAPGPYLADYDARAPSALSDITVASELGLPVVLASHSIGPLPPAALAAVGRARLCVAREPATQTYLRERGIQSHLAADLAFVYPYPEDLPPGRIEAPYRLIFLRSNNLDAALLRLEDGAIFEGRRLIAAPSSDPVVLATSDYRRDRRYLARAARRLGVAWVGCRRVSELVQLIAGSSGVVSDRYHPAICAAALGKPAQVLMNREPHKMHGLQDLLAGHTFEELRALARTGLDSVRAALRGAG